MINYIKRFFAARRSVAEYVELNRLLVKAGRRCAYDLKHAASSIHCASLGENKAARLERGSKDSSFYHDRSYYWLGVFNPADDGKSYRDKLHHSIWDLESKIEEYKKLLKAHGIEDGISADEIPF
jgi:hypothetical protein